MSDRGGISPHSMHSIEDFAHLLNCICCLFVILVICYLHQIQIEEELLNFIFKKIQITLKSFERNTLNILGHYHIKILMHNLEKLIGFLITERIRAIGFV